MTYEDEMHLKKVKTGTLPVIPLTQSGLVSGKSYNDLILPEMTLVTLDHMI